MKIHIMIFISFFCPCNLSLSPLGNFLALNFLNFPYFLLICHFPSFSKSLPPLNPPGLSKDRQSAEIPTHRGQGWPVNRLSPHRPPLRRLIIIIGRLCLHKAAGSRRPTPHSPFLNLKKPPKAIAFRSPKQLFGRDFIGRLDGIRPPPPALMSIRGRQSPL